jgi:hypothetical protein
MTFQFLCPQGHLLQGEEAHMGMQCQCPQCGTAFIIPVLDRPGAAAGTSSGQADPSEIELAPLPADDEPSPADSRISMREALAELHVEQLDDSEVADAMGALLHIPCPNGHELEVPIEMVGQRAMCPHCGVEFKLRQEKSVEYQRQREIIERKQGELWFKLAIAAAGVVVAVLLIMILATMFT